MVLIKLKPEPTEYILRNSTVSTISKKGDLYIGKVNGIEESWNEDGTSIPSWYASEDYDVVAEYEGSLLETLHKNHAHEL